MSAFTNKKQEQIRFGICFTVSKVIKHTKKTMLFVIVVLAIVSLSLLVSGKRVLVWETKVNPGENYVLAEWGDLGKATQAQLVCRYFTGRSISINVFWYSPNNFMGRDQCPFIASE